MKDKENQEKLFERITREIIVMLNEQTDLPWIDKLLFGYIYERTFNEIVNDMRNLNSK